jgi:hypothetical protein
MAFIQPKPKTPPTQIKKFLGLNEDTTGDTQLELGESPKMLNFRITENYKLQSREGYQQLFESLGEHPIRGMWYGKIKDAYHFLFACNGKLYEHDLAAKTNTEIGSLTDAPTTFFTFADKLYILNGHEYKVWDGTTLADVVGYIPTIAISTPPEGGGTPYEQINLLTPKKKQLFSGNGTAKDFQLAESDLDSIDKVVVDGVEQTVNDDYTIDLTAGKVSFTTEPTNNTDNVEIQWTKHNWKEVEDSQQFTGDGEELIFQLRETGLESIDKVTVEGIETNDYTADLVEGTVTFNTAPTGNIEISWTKKIDQNRPMINQCRAAVLFGGENDTRVHFWGNSDYKNRRFTSGITLDNSSGAEYFPANSHADIGSFETAITAIIRQYDRMIILKERAAYYSYYELVEDIGSFPVYPLNGSIGNVAFNQAQLIQNNPVSIFSGVYEWVATAVRDERNAVYISKRVQPSLDEVDLAQAITYDYEYKGEYWLCVGKIVWVFNYRNGTWYKFELADTPTCFLVIDKELYFGTDTGQIMGFVKDQFGDDLRHDNGQDITYRWEMGFYDFQAEWLRKFVNRIWVSIQPGSKEKVKLTWQADRTVSGREYLIQYNLMDYTKIDYTNWSYLTYYNPQPIRLKVKAKKFVYLKLIFENTTKTERATILSINLLARAGGEAK